MLGLTSLLTVAGTAALTLASPTKRDTYSGDGTYYDVGLGACGITNSASQLVCAVSEDMYDTWPGATTNPNLNPICGQVLTAFYGSNQVTVTVVDRCTNCSFYDIDFSRGAFDELADESLGRIQITWEWDAGSGPGTTSTPAPTSTTTTSTAAPTTTTPASSGSCAGVAAWSSALAYTAGEEVTYNGELWSANYWTEADVPGGISGDWTLVGTC